MKLLYMYYRGRRGAWYDVRICIWLCRDALYSGDNKIHKTFNRLEEVRLFASTDPVHYHACTYENDFSGDSCHGHWAKTVQEFLVKEKDTRCYPMVPITKESYNRIKKFCLKVYQSYPPLDLEAILNREKKTHVTYLTK